METESRDVFEMEKADFVMDLILDWKERGESQSTAVTASEAATQLFTYNCTWGA